jgi:hypothetical protein
MNIKPTLLHLSGRLVTQLYQHKYKLKPVLRQSKVPIVYKEEYSINSGSLTKEERKATRAIPKSSEDSRTPRTILFYST